MTALAPAVSRRGRRASGGLGRRTRVIAAVVAIGLVMPALDTERRATHPAEARS